MIPFICNLPTTESTTTEMITYPPLPVDCNFESGFCTWQSDLTAEFQWLRQTGANLTQSPQIDRINFFFKYKFDIMKLT